MKTEAELVAELMQRPAAERARIASALLRSLDDDEDDDPAEVAAAWDAEIERRMGEIDRGEAETISIEEFREHMRMRRAALVARAKSR